MKTFMIIHHLAGGSGHIITAVQAETETAALQKYKPSGLCHIGIICIEVTKEVQEIYRYDNPNYEG